MSSLDYHRKQAKLYLKWHREGRYPCAAAIRALLPKFHGMSDKQVLDSEFKLADAQALVAGKAGFENWTALTKGVKTMTESDFVQKEPVLLLSEPQLFVTEIGAAIEFYRDKLGFAVRFTYGEPPFYAQVFRDGAALNLRHVDQHPIDGERRIREHLVVATIVVGNIKPLFVTYKEAGVTFFQPLKTEPWGARTFIVSDPDGNLVCFAADG